MKRFLYAFFAILISVLISCGGSGGSVDNAIEDDSFTIGYNANGAESGTAPRVQTGTNGSSLSISANTGSLAKNGYLFDGWNTSSDGSGADYTPGTPYSGKNITLYAKWARIFNYHVINGGSPAPALDGAQRSPALPSASITGLTAKGQTLSDIDIPESIDGYTVSNIGENAFRNCDNIANVTIPDTVTNIGDNAFNGCSNMHDMTMLGTVPPTMGAEVFYSCSVVISVPQVAVGAYQEAVGWLTYKTNIFSIGTSTFSVAYDGNGSDGGKVPMMRVSVVGGSPITVDGNTDGLTRAGCTFNGWNTAPDGSGNRFIAGNTVQLGGGRITLYAQWYHEDYVVAFDSQLADTDASPSSVTIKAPANTMGALPTSPIKAGYRFAGWYTLPDGVGTLFTTGSPVLGNMTVSAKWVYNPTYTVTFDSQGANTPASPTSKQVIAPATTMGGLPTPPVKSGYYFGGWFTAPNGAGQNVDGSTVISSNITLYAKWNLNPTYTVTFDGQGATTSANPTSKQVVAPAITVGSLPSNPTRDGYAFDGWYTEPGGAGEIFTASTVVAESITVYANWTAIYSIKYEGNNNTNGRAPEIQIGQDGSIITLHGRGNLERAGYTFNGWNTKADGSGTNYSAGASHTISDNLVLYAKWLQLFTITYDSNGATDGSTPSVQHGIQGESITVQSNIGNLIKTGYWFGGWDTNPTGTTSRVQFTLGASDVTLYAIWIPKYIEKVNLNIGDIVLQNGKYVSYQTFSSHVTDYMAISHPAGVICYKGETGTAGITGKIYMVGLTQRDYLKWALSETTGCNTSFRTSSTSGEGNWGVIQETDPTGSAVGSNYPAFDYANTYSVIGYTSGWFLPSIEELRSIYTYKRSINNSISTIRTAGGTATYIDSKGGLWSSTDGNSTMANYFNLDDNTNVGGRPNGCDKDDTNSVRAVRALDD